ncbi:Y-family DNA polymerase [Parabacteroides distasonis]|jgi:umuC protein|uniref:Y-family DNA polymerase n=1 Tax=Parabacteroides distasonis TaxID=823 RepID=UPI00232B99DE|nr:Y-family DNA polymerase [Parabacteroides distasonis]MDB9001150.1 Y-family DNA polymerase [Parabacteroides distasonis]MDB9017325.1 Y-family DNA polymerase [Parabacteroides distasonis]MDB9055417.1 Y-family DNA polymerase [Parabacteroides distasonis]
MIALVDCNNFYASCERAFNPNWNNRPVVVLSNNDGCVIARSNEAKALGIKMGVPAYQIKNEIERYGIGVFSSNYTLYGDMSNRVMTMLSSYSPNIEVYSIDECFLDFSGFERYNLKEYGEEIVRTVSKGTGIPVSMGIAPTKTLAKVANKFAKKYKGYKGVCIIDTEEKRIEALKRTEIGDVWGIGHRYTKRLALYGVSTAYDFAQMPKAWVRQQMTVVGERTWKELNGEPCIDLELVTPDKKQICTSRAFGEAISEIEGLEEAVSSYASICAGKLRKQRSCAQALMVFIHTNNFREDLPQYFQNCVVKLPLPTNNTPEIVHYALIALRNIYRKGYFFKKAGVIIIDIVPDSAIQQNMFDNVDRERQKKLMKVVDRLNSGFNRNNLTLAVQGGRRKWKLKQELLSPCYTTRLSDIINIK